MKKIYISGIVTALALAASSSGVVWYQLNAVPEEDVDKEVVHISRTAGEGYWCSQELSLSASGLLTSKGTGDRCPTFHKTLKTNEMERIRTIFQTKIITCPKSNGSLIDFQETITFFENGTVSWRSSAPYGACGADVSEVEQYLQP